MSYLTLPAGVPNFSKAVISLWLRAPKESVIAASKSKLELSDPDFPIMVGVLPLVTFGKPQMGKSYSTPQKNVAVIHPHPSIPDEPRESTTYFTPFYEERSFYDIDPSYIGLVCYDDGTFDMVFNFQMDSYMDLRATRFVTTVMDIWSGADPSGPVASAGVLGSGVVTLFPNVGIAKIQDVSYVDNTQPECFTVISDISFKPDEWHHLLLSFDVGGSVSIGTPFAASSCRLWYAIDDTDYRGAENLLPYRDTGGQWGRDTLDPNAILTKNAWALSGTDPNWQARQYYQNQFVGLPSGSYDGGSVPSRNADMGLPAAAKYVNGIFRVEMAEFQLFTGVVLNTGIKTNRRAFVDDKGNPVDPMEGTESDPRGPGERLLGKRPEILLHGNKNWQDGYNTGALGILIDADGNATDLSNGQFQPTGGIEKYTPEPSLEKTTA